MKDKQQQINKKINQLPPYHQLAFGLMLCERFLPNYFAFFLVEQWGNPMVLLNGIDLLKNVVSLQTYDEGELQLVDEWIEEVTPDMDDFPSNTLASLALDTASLLHECFEFVRDRQAQHIVACSEIALDTLRVFIQKRDQLPHDLPVQDLEKRCSQDELMLAEVEYQLQLLDTLTAQPRVDSGLYIRQARNAPKLTLGHLPGVKSRVAV
jgi:uncharacterized protein YjaG (DUF416 family)